MAYRADVPPGAELQNAPPLPGKKNQLSSVLSGFYQRTLATCFNLLEADLPRFPFCERIDDGIEINSICELMLDGENR